MLSEVARSTCFWTEHQNFFIHPGCFQTLCYRAGWCCGENVSGGILLITCGSCSGKHGRGLLLVHRVDSCCCSDWQSWSTYSRHTNLDRLWAGSRWSPLRPECVCVCVCVCVCCLIPELLNVKRLFWCESSWVGLRLRGRWFKSSNTAGDITSGEVHVSITRLIYKTDVGSVWIVSMIST